MYKYTSSWIRIDRNHIRDKDWKKSNRTIFIPWQLNDKRNHMRVIAYEFNVIDLPNYFYS